MTLRISRFCRILRRSNRTAHSFGTGSKGLHRGNMIPLMWIDPKASASFDQICRYNVVLAKKTCHGVAFPRDQRCSYAGTERLRESRAMTLSIAFNCHGGGRNDRSLTISPRMTTLGHLYPPTFLPMHSGMTSSRFYCYKRASAGS